MKIHEKIEEFFIKGKATGRKGESIDLICQDMTTSNHGIKIPHDPPNDETINAGEIIVFKRNNCPGKIDLIMKPSSGDVLTTMSYFEDDDIYIGEKILKSNDGSKQNTYQLVLSMIDFSNNNYLFQITYHNLCVKLLDDMQNHDGTIHPWP